ncbi:hypothetical protein BGZ51_002550 [Haplosporangium sp. Z 767]|nr:hypothetical protein BGZ51_002550 [Haplosporangium sp. Z 767]
MSLSWSPSPLIPPFRFGTVECDVYRGAYPKQRNLRYLKRLKLKTILSLVPDKPDQIFQDFCTEQSIRTIHLSVDKVKDNVPLTYNRAVEAVQIIIDPDNLPIYIHCLDGASVTGLVVCCIRKLQTWNISSAMGEFLRYLRGGVISSEESVFVEKFASEIEISKPVPSWLWEGQVAFKKHPSLKLNFTIPPAAATALNTVSTSASSPIISNQGSTMVVFPGQQNNWQTQGNSGNTGSAGTTQSGTNNSVSIATGTGPAVGSGAPGGTSSSSLTPSGLLNHASRSSAKATLRDRPCNNKNIIRTDIMGATGYASKNTTISTPTTAALTRNKRATGTHSSMSQQVSSHEQSPFEFMGSGSGLGVRLNSQPTTSISMGAGSTSTESSTGGSSTIGTSGGSNLRGSTAHRGGETISRSEDDAYTTKGISLNGVGHKAEDFSNDGASILTTAAQERNVNQQSAIKNSPATANAVAAAQEVVDEYYEVSMTLKALALEGADF